MNASVDAHISAFDCGTLSLAEEAVLSQLRDAVAAMRNARMVADLAYIEKEISAAGGSRVGGNTGAIHATFDLNGSRFTLRVVPGLIDRVEVSFLGGDTCRD